MRHIKRAQNVHTIEAKARLATCGLALAVLAALAIAPAADAARSAHRLRLDSTIFAAQVGSTPGGSVYAGAVVDRKLDHGAVVYATFGTTSVRVIFHEYFAVGSISGIGRITLVPGTGSAPSRLMGTLKVTGGTAAYRTLRGKLSVTGTIDSTGMTMATVKGTLT